MNKKIILFGNYFLDFLSKLSVEEREKIERAISLFERKDRIPFHYISYIRDGVFEFRVTYRNNEFRIFFIYDGNSVVILFNGFRKKTQKTPQREIEKAIRLKQQYYEQKES